MSLTGLKDGSSKPSSTHTVSNSSHIQWFFQHQVQFKDIYHSLIKKWNALYAFKTGKWCHPVWFPGGNVIDIWLGSAVQNGQWNNMKASGPSPMSVTDWDQGQPLSQVAQQGGCALMVLRAPGMKQHAIDCTNQRRYRLDYVCKVPASALASRGGGMTGGMGGMTGGMGGMTGGMGGMGGQPSPINPWGY